MDFSRNTRSQEQTISAGRQTQTFADGLARVIRIICVPPLMVSVLILILALHPEAGVFLSAWDIWVTVLGLAVCPVLAYPISVLVPGLREKGRHAQRMLAIILSAVGYLGAWVYGLCSHCSAGLMMIFNAYLISVLLILFFNKVIRFKVSGHATSISGPIAFLLFFMGWWGLLGLIVYGLSFWASVRTHRHTVREFIGGTAVCAVAFIVSWLIYIF